ncbi:MAG: methyltransferase domain-containing protein [Syntrophobacteria bacterium]|jgi:ubiquinone/menaquinone biosynthesis C-methylase UbiE
MEKTETVAQDVKKYYGQVLEGNKDLKTSVCCSTDALPRHHKEILKQIDHEILEKFYGCGSPTPLELEGCTVLDLGCGTGRDVFLASRLVGPQGRVIGVDMTEEQLSVALKHVASQTKKFGYENPNVEFKLGYIEDLKELGIEENSTDIVTSNCVINLSSDKRAVFSDIFRVLKPGGELYFSDIFAGRRIPEHLKTDPVLRGECLAGSLYIEDFRRILREIGFLDYRIVSKTRIELEDEEVFAKIGMVDFYSMTIRAFKLDDLEDICEDYGQVAVYLGTVAEAPHYFTLDDHHVFIKGKPELICGNTASMLSKTRLSRHFKITGDRNYHYGPFDCNSTFSKMDEGNPTTRGACC